ncbi:MAG: hypothetical protein AB1806_16040 [Acidobacteriota bacterium]
MVATSGPYRIVALHGFLGGPDDWLPLRLRLPGVWWSPLDLWAIVGRAEVRDWSTLGGALEAEIASAAAAEPRLPAVVLAYSFGARMMLASPGAASRVAGTCLVSCNPGLKAEDGGAREARRVSDETWAQRLLDWEPAALFQAWNRQPSLASSVPIPTGSNFPAARVTLARAMRSFSLAGQPDWHGRLRAWPGPVLVVAGERDGRYAAIASGFEGAGGHLDVRVVSGAGHRVPWDAPDQFVETLAAWAEGLISRSRA